MSAATAPQPVKLPPVTVAEDDLGYRPYLEDVISAALEAGLKDPTPPRPCACPRSASRRSTP